MKGSTTAVVVHYARDELTDALLSDLLGVAAQSVERVVVVDNGSPVPYSPRVAHPQVSVVRLEEGRGYGGAATVGRQHASGDHFLLLNNDVRLPHDPVPALLARRAAGAALVGPRVEYPDGRYQLSWGDELTLVEEFQERRRQRQMRAGQGSSFAQRELASGTARRVDWLSGVTLFVDTASFDSVGGFDEEFHFYFEDVDLCRRLAEAGYEAWYEPGARISHLLGGTRDSGAVHVPERIGVAHVLGHLRYYRRHRPAWEHLVLKAMLLIQVRLSPAYRSRPWQRSLLHRIWKE